MHGEKKAPGKKLFLILGCVVLAIIAAVMLVTCAGHNEEPPTPTQPQNTAPATEPTQTEPEPIKPQLEKPEDVTVEGLKEEYEIGEEVAFTVTTSDEYSVISKVKISGDKVEPDEDGYYRATVSNRLYIIIETELVCGDAVITIEESNGHLHYDGVPMTFTLQQEEDAEEIKVKGTVKDGKVTLEKMPVGTYDISPVYFFGGQLRFSPITVSERENELTTKREVGINDSIKSGSVYVSVAASSVSIRNCNSDKSGNILLQGQSLGGDVWFGMKVKLSAEDLQATDYRNVGINIYKNGSSRVQVLSLGDGRAAVKYDNDHVKELSSGLVDALEAGKLLLAVRRTGNGQLEVYAGAYAEDMTRLFTVENTNMKTAVLDQFGLDMKGPIKDAGIYNLESGYSMTSVLPSTKETLQDVTIRVKSSSDSVSFEGVELTFTLKREPEVRYTGVVTDGCVTLTGVAAGTYQVSPVALFGGQLTFEDAIVIEGVEETSITHNERINDTVQSDSVAVDVLSSSVSVKELQGSKSSNIFLQGQNLTGDVWFGMKARMSSDDLQATDYRNIGINIYRNGSNRIQLVSLGNGRVAIKYDNNHVKELSSDMAQALSSVGILLAVHRTERGALEVYTGVHSEEMAKMFTVESPNMGAEALDQFGLDVQGPMQDAAIENLLSGGAMAEVLAASDGGNQTLTLSVKGRSERMNFAGVEFTFTLVRDPSVQFTAAADKDGKIVLENAPVGTYQVSDVDVLGGKLTFADVLVWEGRTEAEMTHKEGVNDSVGSASAAIDVASSSVFFEDSAASANRSDGYFFLQSQKLTGNVWFGMKVKMSGSSLTGNAGASVALCIYENGWNLIQVTSAGDGTATVGFNYNYTVTLPGELLSALTGDGMYLAANRAADGTLQVYGGAKAEEMLLLVTVTDASPVKTNMGTGDLDQFGFMTQGKIASASMENIASGAEADAALNGFAVAQEDVTLRVQNKSKNTKMSFAGMAFTFTLKHDASVAYTGTVDADGKLAVEDMLAGTYSVSAVDLFGRELTFSDITVQVGKTEVELTYAQGINDNVNSASVTVGVLDSSVTIDALESGKGYFFLQDQKLTGEAWFAMKVSLSGEDLAAADYRNLGIQTYGTGGADYIQVLNLNGKGAAIKYDNSHVYTLSEDMVAALKAGQLYLAVCRTADGKLVVYAGTATNQMVRLFTVANPKIGTNAIEQFGVNINGPIVSAGVADLSYGAAAEEALAGFAVAKENVTIHVKGKSDKMSFAGVRLTFTLKNDTTVAYTAVADANGQITVSDMLHGTYSVSGVDFFGGQLTFPELTVQAGATEVELTHAQGVNDKIGSASARIDVASSSVFFENSTATTNRGDGYFFLQGQKLTGDVWFGMKVKMSAASLTGNKDAFVALCIYEGGWNLIQVVSNGDGTASVKFNYNYAAALSQEQLSALTGDGMYLAANRAADGTLRVYGGAKPTEMSLLVTVTANSDPKPNMGTADLDQFGFMTQGKISGASMENIASGATVDAVISGFEQQKETVTVSIKAKSSRMSFAGVKLTFTHKLDQTVSYTATADANGQIVVNDMLHGNYSVSSIDFLGGKLTFPDIVVEKGTAAVEITHNEAIQDDITADANTVRVDVATSSVYVTNYTGQNRNQGAFYLKDQTLSGDVWFGMRLKVSKTDWTEKDGYPYIAWNSFVGNNWNFIQVMNNNGNGVGAIKYNNNYAKGLTAAQAAAVTGDGLLMLLHRTTSGTMEVYLGTNSDDMTLMFTVNATASSGKPALNLGTKDLENFGFLIRCMTGGSSAPDIKSASIENMVSGKSMDEVLGKF